jgi:two-component system OmpR family sensor kinase
MFSGFRGRLTRGYVLLAIALILAVAAASTALAFFLYTGSLSESISNAAQRASEEVTASQRRHEPLAKAAPAIAHDVGRGRFRVAIFDSQRRLLAANEAAPRPSAGGDLSRAFGSLIGLPRARVPVAGGMVFIEPDLDRFSRVLVWYWSIMLPVGLLAILLAWLIGRRISARAVGPLAEVTKSLRRIAEGDFTPETLLGNSTDFRELTTAYNDVAKRLTAATAERKQSDAQMRQFIADAGHELRTPLTIVMGYLDVLRQGVISDSAGTTQIYETMLDESRRMRALIEKLIYLARLDRAGAPQKLTTVDISATVARAVQSLTPLADGRITVSAADHATVNIDEDEMYEAIKNVIDNALKYAPESQVEVSTTRDDGTVCVRVKDSGPGMDSADIAHAFDRFYRGSARADIEGSGLGLAIAKRAVERAGGSIKTESTPGHGTTVILCLPVTPR